jgi:RNA polymerase sigma-70 factor (ECF subfamily)
MNVYGGYGSTEQDEAFKAELVALIPQMRAFARTLCRDATFADDLAQDALARAWACRSSYEPGTNLKAWTFRILRNGFYSQARRSRRSHALDPGVAEATLVAVSNPTGALELNDVRLAMNMLPREQREALTLIVAAGLSYEETAGICGVAVGTIKSRVSRARERLLALLAEGELVEDGIQPSAAMEVLMVHAAQLQECA